MKTIIKLSFLLCLVTLVSCNRERTVVDDYEDLVEELETKGGDFDKEQWEDYFVRCGKLEEKMEDATLSKEQQLRMLKLHGRMVAAITKHGGKMIKDVMEDASEQIGAFSEGFMEGISEGLQTFTESLDKAQKEEVEE